MPISNYPHGFAHGVTVRDIPVDTRLAGVSNVYWVDSVHGSNGNPGTFTQPFATIDYAVGRCTANQGDKIYVAAGHNEAVIAAGTLTFDVAGISVVFLGEGTSKAKITFSTVVTASVVISANNITLVNPKFVADIDALTGPIRITGTDCTIIDGEWYDAAAKAATDCIVATTAASRLTINGWKFYASTTGTQKQSNIKITATDSTILTNIDIAGDFATGNINNATTECTNLRLENIKLVNTNATPKPGMVLQANTAGLAKNIDIRIASATTYVSSVAKMNWDANCVGYNTDGHGGDPIGTADTLSVEGQIATAQADITAIKSDTDKIDGATLAVSPTAGSLARFIASGGTALGTSLDASKSLVDAIGSNGTTLVYGAGSILGAVGTEFIVKKSLVSSAITQAGVDVTGVSSVGELEIMDVVLETDGTGLAAGTAVQLKTDNAYGAEIWAQELVANLGASATVSTPSAVNKKVVVETGKKVTINSTVADCTGAGVLNVYIRFKRIAAGAIIAAA